MPRSRSWIGATMVPFALAGALCGAPIASAAVSPPFIACPDVPAAQQTYDHAVSALRGARARLEAAKNATTAATASVTDAQTALAAATTTADEKAAAQARLTTARSKLAAAQREQEDAMLAEQNARGTLDRADAALREAEAGQTGCSTGRTEHPKPGGDGSIGEIPTPRPDDHRPTSDSPRRPELPTRPDPVVIVVPPAQTTVSTTFDVSIDGSWWPRHYVPDSVPTDAPVASNSEVSAVPVGPADTGDGSTAGQL